MSTIKITDDNRETTTSLLNSYSLEPLEEGLILELNLPNSFIKYLIHSDIREHNIRNIEQFIINYFDDVITNNKTAYIEEYLQRDYINIGQEETCRQFTAQKR